MNMPSQLSIHSPYFRPSCRSVNVQACRVSKIALPGFYPLTAQSLEGFSASQSSQPIIAQEPDNDNRISQLLAN